jgi:hypothetical protein
LCTSISSHTICRPLLTSFPMSEIEREMERGKREREREGNKGNTEILGALYLLPPRAMAEQDWTPSIIMLIHGGDGAHGLPCARGPSVPAPAEGYVVSFVTLYEWRFGTPSHRFFRSLLRHYGLELHKLTPLGVLHIVAFMTLCEAYLGIDPNFNL